MKKKINYYRKPLQWIVVILLGYLLIRPLVDKQYLADFEAYCPFGGLQALSSYLVSNTLACSMTTMQIAMGIALLVGVVLVSKLFCSFLCPIGMFTEWIGKWRGKWEIRYNVTGIADKILRILKYLLLFTTFYFTLTSSELFCHKFDPYYALFSGFPSDVTLAWALAALALVILGSLFVRQFWCKYLCPLGAAANIFTYFIAFAIITAFYLLYNIVFHFPWVWYLAIVCIVGYILEIWMMKGWIFPLFKITRNDSVCTHCKLCDKACPMAIPVSTMDKVNHIDCHLCTDCLHSCPTRGALTINRRRWPWLPAIAVVVLVGAAIVFASRSEIPTIDVRWGAKEDLAKANVFNMDGLKSIKCYGSSMSFAEQMKEVKGVLGVASFVKSHSVKIYFDPTLTNTEEIKKAVFTPVLDLVNIPPRSQNTIAVAEIGLNNFFDVDDEFLLTELLSQQDGFYGLETMFGEPVKTRIFFDRMKIAPDVLADIIQSEEVKYIQDGKQIIEKINFKIAEGAVSVADIAKSLFYQRMFKPMDDMFNGFEKYKPDALAVVEVEATELLYPELREKLPYLESHLSGDEGIVRMQTQLNYDGPMLRIHYVIAKTDKAKVLKALHQPRLMVFYPDGTSEKMDNPFHFEPMK